MYTIDELDYEPTDSTDVDFKSDVRYFVRSYMDHPVNGYLEIGFKHPGQMRDYYFISITEPEFVIKPEEPLTKERYDMFIKDLDNGLWSKIIDAYEYLCESGCSEDRFECPGYIARQEILKHMSDYKLLPHLEG